MKPFLTRWQKTASLLWVVRLVFGVNHERTEQWLMSIGSYLPKLKAFDILFSIDSAVNQPAIIPAVI